MLGFTLPLFIVVGLESVLGLLLLCPKPLNQPAIRLARASYTQVGATVFHTLAGVLALLLVSPLYDGVRLYRGTQQASNPEQASLDMGEHEARTLLSASLTGGALFAMFVLRRLGSALGDLDRMSVSEAALLKQVKGLQSEYSRMLDTSAGAAGAKGGAGAGAAAAPAGPSGAGADAGAGAGAGGDGLSPGEVAELRKLLADLEKQNSTLQARCFKVEKEHQEAERNLSALKTQARGLESEYDRLLASYNDLQRQAARAGLPGADAALAAAAGFGKKDE